MSKLWHVRDLCKVFEHARLTMSNDVCCRLTCWVRCKEEKGRLTVMFNVKKDCRQSLFPQSRVSVLYI